MQVSFGNEGKAWSREECVSLLIRGELKIPTSSFYHIKNSSGGKLKTFKILIYEVVLTAVKFRARGL